MFNPVAFYEAGKVRAKVNTIIGGVASAISTKALLATRLGISESSIIIFKIVGSDVQANINISYSIPNNAFLNLTSLTKYLDLDGKVTSAGIASIQNTSLNELYMPNMTTAGSGALSVNLLTNLSLNVTILGAGICSYSSTLKTINLHLLESLNPTKTNAFADLTACELIDMRKLKVYGAANTGSSATNSGFANLKMGCEIRINDFLRTVNSGAVNPSFAWVKANRGAIVKFYDDSGNYVSTL